MLTWTFKELSTQSGVSSLIWSRSCPFVHDIYISSMLEELLVREGYGVLRAYSGTEALLLLEEKKPDLVLLDLMLPGLSAAHR